MWGKIAVSVETINFEQLTLRLEITGLQAKRTFYNLVVHTCSVSSPLVLEACIENCGRPGVICNQKRKISVLSKDNCDS